jgi:hypothetical protein
MFELNWPSGFRGDVNSMIGYGRTRDAFWIW